MKWPHKRNRWWTCDDKYGTKDASVKTIRFGIQKVKWKGHYKLTFHQSGRKLEGIGMERKPSQKPDTKKSIRISHNSDNISGILKACRTSLLGLFEPIAKNEAPESPPAIC
jgi:hypothetical protein